MSFRWHRGPSAASLMDDLLRALAYAEARASIDTPAESQPEDSADAAGSRRAPSDDAEFGGPPYGRGI
jgi:hypothetical protein